MDFEIHWSEDAIWLHKPFVNIGSDNDLLLPDIFINYVFKWYTASDVVLSETITLLFLTK